jgi:hypothetical protein
LCYSIYLDAERQVFSSEAAARLGQIVARALTPGEGAVRLIWCAALTRSIA